MAALKALSHWRHGTHLFVCSYQRVWHPSSCATLCMAANDITRRQCPGSSCLLRHGTTDTMKRHYSVLSVNRCTLELQKSQNSALLMQTSRRNFEFNLFYMLIELVEGQFIGVKNITGLDWWLTIVLCTLPYRVAIAYFMRKKQVDMDYKVQHIQTTLLPPIQRVEMREIMQSRENMHLTQHEKHEIFTRVMSQQLKRLYKEHNCDPWKIFIYNLSPLPFWVANSWALQHLSGSALSRYMSKDGILCPDMQTQGLLWFPNLCLADAYHILPVICGLSFLLMTELYTVSSRSYGQKLKSNNFASKLFAKTMKYFQFFTRAWTIVFVYIIWDRSAAMTYYWCMSGLTALVVRLILLHPAVDRYFAPKNMHYLHDKNPYRTIFKNMQNRYNPKNWFLGNK